MVVADFLGRPAVRSRSVLSRLFQLRAAGAVCYALGPADTLAPDVGGRHVIS